MQVYDWLYIMCTIVLVDVAVDRLIVYVKVSWLIVSAQVYAAVEWLIVSAQVYAAVWAAGGRFVPAAEEGVLRLSPPQDVSHLTNLTQAHTKYLYFTSQFIF